MQDAEASRSLQELPKSTPTRSAETPIWDPRKVSSIMKGAMARETRESFWKTATLKGLIDSLTGLFPPSAKNAMGGGNSAIVDAAKTFEGTKYVWGGQGKDGIDCSGLVVEAMKLAGKPIPDMTAAQMLAQTDPISPAEAQPGDLVLKKDGTHVEIFTGMQGAQFATIGSASSRKGVSAGTLSPGEYVIHRNNLSEKSSGDFPQSNNSNGQMVA